MPTAHFQSAAHALGRAERPVLCIARHGSVDEFAAAIALHKAAAMRGKVLQIVSEQPLPDRLTFLEPPQIQKDIEHLRTLTLSLSTKKAQVEELSYTVENDELQIHIIPKSGIWGSNDVKISTTGFTHDLAVMIGGTELSAFGSLSRSYADFFYDTPLLIVHPTPLEGEFGQYHVSDPLASSLSELVAAFLETHWPETLTPEIATALLTGMMARTKSFKTDGIAPKTLDLASRLIAAGADREKIVEKLYRTRSVEILRLWGHALSRLDAEREIGLAWTTLTRRDLVSAKATEDLLVDVVEELVTTAPDARVILLCYEKTTGGIGARLFAERPHDALLLAAPFHPIGTKDHVELTLEGTDIVAAEQTVLAHLRTVLKQSSR